MLCMRPAPHLDNYAVAVAFAITPRIIGVQIAFRVAQPMRWFAFVTRGPVIAKLADGIARQQVGVG